MTRSEIELATSALGLERRTHSYGVVAFGIGRILSCEADDHFHGIVSVDATSLYTFTKIIHVSYGEDEYIEFRNDERWGDCFGKDLKDISEKAYLRNLIGVLENVIYLKRQ